MSATELVNACVENRFPSLSVVTKYGLDGNGGTNPVFLLSCYREAIMKDGVTDTTIEKFFKMGEINKLILENSDSVKYLDCYEKVLQKGGIRSSWDLQQLECHNCKMCAIHSDDICNNCGTAVKKYTPDICKRI